MRQKDADLAIIVQNLQCIILQGFNIQNLNALPNVLFTTDNLIMSYFKHKDFLSRTEGVYISESSLY